MNVYNFVNNHIEEFEIVYCVHDKYFSNEEAAKIYASIIAVKDYAEEYKVDFFAALAEYIDEAVTAGDLF